MPKKKAKKRKYPLRDKYMEEQRRKLIASGAKPFNMWEGMDMSKWKCTNFVEAFTSASK